MKFVKEVIGVYMIVTQNQGINTDIYHDISLLTYFDIKHLQN